jgi:hypothetical protein
MKVVRLSALRTDRLHSSDTSLVLISARRWVDPWAISRPEGLLCQCKIPMAPLGIAPTTCLLVAQCLDELRHRVTPTFFFTALKPLVGQDCHIHAAWLHLDTTHSVGHLWTHDQPDAETSTGQHTAMTRVRHSCPSGFRTHIPSIGAGADPRLRPRGN